MKIVEIMPSIAGAVIFVVWVYCMFTWFNRGLSIPRYIHSVAVALTLIGAGCLVFAIAGKFFDWRLAIACLAVPAPVTYLGWLWLFGPEFSKKT